MRTKELFKFVRERWNIYDRRCNAGLPKPWTADPILQQYRFCNVYREYDTQTKWFAQNWREPNAADTNLWFAALVFRLTNWHMTAGDLGYPVPWNANKFIRVLELRKAAGVRVFNPAYIVSTNGVAQEKHLYLAEKLSIIWKDRLKYQFKRDYDSLKTMHERLMESYGVGSFIAGQVIADAKYAGAMLDAPDWYDWAASGPGSRRGLNRVMGVSITKSWKEREWFESLQDLHAEIIPLVAAAGMPDLHAQDLQNCLCEFDKYERIRLGEGRPKQRYNGEG